MDESKKTEEKDLEENKNGFGRVVDTLHSKNKISSLRTYQGDVANFMKEKNESVISVVLKEKAKKEEETVEKKARGKSSFQINLTMIVSSLLLILGGTVAFIYVYDFITKERVVSQVLQTEIIPYNNLVTLNNISKENLSEEIYKVPNSGGTTVIKIAGKDGSLITEAKVLFDLLEIEDRFSINRNLKSTFMLGSITQSSKNHPFLIITVGDFGVAFSSMLEWEKDMQNSLSFLNTQRQVGTINTSTLPTQPDEDLFTWRDVIIKNKDIRALANNKGETKISYAFLDKNTIIITGDAFVIGDISSIYASRPVVR